MNFNIKGKLKSIKLDVEDFLLPLFEAVINAVQAIEEQGEEGRKNGHIEVKIFREQISGDSNAPIDRFEVSDSGVGFTEKNFEAFREAYTECKLEKDGKGVGRFTMLKAFKEVIVQSVYEGEGKFIERNFTFSEDGIKEGSFKDSEKKRTGSTVILKEYSERSLLKKSGVRREEVAQKIVEHCFVYLLCGIMPDTSVTEGGSSISLQDVLGTTTQWDSHTLGREKEQISAYFVRDCKGEGDHRMRLCAHNRVVKGISLSELVGDLGKRPLKHKGEEHGHVLSVYVVGEDLDRYVNETRNGFRFPKKSNENQKYDVFPTPSLDKIKEAVKEKIEEIYHHDIGENRKRKKEAVQKYLRSEGAAQFLHLRNSKEPGKIPLGNIEDEGKIRQFLFEIACEKEKKNEEELKKVKNGELKGREATEAIKEHKEISYSKLGAYMEKRHETVRLLEQYIGYKPETQSHYPEKEIHNLIYPKGKDSGDGANHNLWLLDERLTFYHYAASDKTMGNSGQRPDVILYDVRDALVEGRECRSVVIFEFKKPDVYKLKEAVEQVKGYADKLGKGVNDHKGRELDVKKETPKFGYVVSNLHGREEQLRNDNFKKTPYGSFYQFFDALTLHMEVLTYNQLVKNVEDRHKEFFKRLKEDLGS